MLIRSNKPCLTAPRGRKGWIRRPELMTRDLWWHVPGEQRWVSVAVTISPTGPSSAGLVHGHRFSPPWSAPGFVDT
jgi:hypothetical protein